MISIVFTALLILSTTAASCAPKFLLPSTLHDSIKIYSFNTSNAATSSSFTYVYMQSLFTGPPQVILSISELISTQIMQINYQLSADLKTNNLNFNFASKNMNWTSLQVQFILHSGTDIASRVDTISITNVGVKSTFNFQIPSQANSANPSFLFSHFIIGVAAPASNQYEIGLQPTSISSGQYSIVAYSNVQATLTIQTVYFDSLQTSFSYAVNELTIVGSQQPQYKAHWVDFAPAIYNLFGFSLIKFSGSTLSIAVNLDEVGSIFTVSSMIGVTNAKLNYLSIGVLPSKVCSPCNNFIAIYGCLDSCPNNSYPQSLNGGGKTCKSCSSTLALALNTDGTTCTCTNGQSYFKRNCYNLGELPPSCGQGQILINNQCISTVLQPTCSQQNQYYDTSSSNCLCVANFERVQGQCLKSCPTNSNRNTNSGICVCSAGFLMNGLYQCVSICPANSYFDTNSNICLCNTNYQMVSGACKSCTQNEAYDQSSRTCVAKYVGIVGISGSAVTVVCQPNEAVVNGICQCNQNSIKMGGKCTPCPPSSYKIGSSNKCGLCSAYCATCQSNTSCNECNNGFQINNQQCQQTCGDGRKFILPCDDGNTNSGDGCSSTCQIQSGYVCNGGNTSHPDVCQKLKANTKISIAINPNSPTYISTAIITEFIVQPPIQRTRHELHRLFSLSFSNNKARPMSIKFSQGDDLTDIRCFFSYNGNLPNDIFKVTFNVQDETYGANTITIMYNSMVNPVKAAVSFLEGTADILE